MLRIRERLGNMHADPELAEQVERWRQATRLEEVTLDERDAHKSRLRVQTANGRALGLILPRGTSLNEGDVFALADQDGGVLIHISLQEVMVLTPSPETDPAERLRRAVRLGHVLGNQHWPVAFVGEHILVPVSLDRAVMETVLRTHRMTDCFRIRYERRAWPRDQHAASPRHSHERSDEHRR